MKQTLFNHLKNIPGWRTNRKLVVISVDDYGNVRIRSKKALSNLEKEGILPQSHFDHYDNLETREDLESLYEVLSSVKDKHGRAAVYTPYALSCNIDFEAMEKNGYQEYIPELLPKTFEKLAAEDTNYEGTWQLWQEGIEKGLMEPQFHGREHFNLPIFDDLLVKQTQNLKKVLKQHCYITIPEHENYSHGWTGAYGFDDISQTKNFLENVSDGLDCFKKVYGYDSHVFTPPGVHFPLHLEDQLYALGIECINLAFRQNRHLGSGKYDVKTHKLGDGYPMKTIVRNVVFEPMTKRHSDWVNFSFKQVETAFFWSKPANISSHRVNFCGGIDERNRKENLAALQKLLTKIVSRWPEVEFVSAGQLGRLITEKPKK